MKTSLKLGYGVGQTSSGVKNAAFAIFLFFYFNQVLGLSGSLAGMASLLALIVDAITDPMVGQLSDRYKSRWGRRHPFMLIRRPYRYRAVCLDARLRDHCADLFDLLLRAAFVARRRNGA
jgi:Na+/melibiose symporter-like transporter